MLNLDPLATRLSNTQSSFVSLESLENQFVSGKVGTPGTSRNEPLPLNVGMVTEVLTYTFVEILNLL